MTSSLDVIVITFSVLIITAGASLSQTFPVASFLALVPFWVVIAKNVVLYPSLRGFSFPRSNNGAVPDSQGLVASLFGLSFVILLAVAFVRTATSGSSTAPAAVGLLVRHATFLLFAFAVYKEGMRVAPRPMLDKAILSAIAVFVVANAALFLCGLRSEGNLPPGDAVMLSVFGIHVPRQSLPLGGGYSTHVVLAGACITISVVMLSNRTIKMMERVGWVVALAAGAATILIVDSRGTALFSLVVAALMILLPTAALRRSHLVIPLLPALPFIALAAALAAVSSGADPELFLTRPDDTSPASRRELIWLAAVEELSSYSAAHLVGFGAYGNHVSGIARHYDDLFTLLATPGLTTLHSAVLQYIFDIGYLGLALFIAMLYVVVKRLGSFVSMRSSDDGWEKAGLSAFFFFLLMGITESVPTIYFAESFFIFILISTSMLLRDMHPRGMTPSAVTPP